MPIQDDPVDELDDKAAREALSAEQAQPPAADAPVSPLTPEARALVEKADRGGVPIYTTPNLARIAAENGVSVSPDKTPNQVIGELRRRG
jgi:hypothetical protein